MAGVYSKMNSKGNLVFRSVPQNYRSHQRVFFAGIDFSGIQRFIFDEKSFEDIHEISDRSGYLSWVTARINRELQLILKDYSYHSITVSSGKIQAVFAYSQHALEIFREYMNQLQRTIFAVNEGHIQLFYGVIKTVVSNNKSKVRQSAFKYLYQEIEINKLRCSNVYRSSLDQHRDNDYTIEKYRGSSIRGSVRSFDCSRLAALKFDLDNLGNFFSRLEECDTIAQISGRICAIINESIEAIPDAALIYAGGDDIFILCSEEAMLPVVNGVYSNILERINHDGSLIPYGEQFGLSCGICVFHKDVPLLFYAEKAEEQLMLSKIRGKNKATLDSVSYEWDELNQLERLFSSFGKTAGKGVLLEFNHYSFMERIRLLLRYIKNETDCSFINKLLIKASE